MPQVHGRYVPEGHASAIMAAREAADTEPEVEEETVPKATKKATRKRGARTVETAMIDEGETSD